MSAGVEHSLSMSELAARALSFPLSCRHFLFPFIGLLDLLLISFLQSVSQISVGVF